MASIPCTSRSKNLVPYNLLTSKYVSSQLKDERRGKKIEFTDKLNKLLSEQIVMKLYNSLQTYIVGLIINKVHAQIYLHIGSLAADSTTTILTLQPSSIRSLMQEDEARVFTDQWGRFDISHFYRWHGLGQVVHGERNAANSSMAQSIFKKLHTLKNFTAYKY